jgi:predicted transcriptional regulator
MNKNQMVSFRLDTASLTKLNILRRCRHRSRGQILREAIDLYFRAYNPIVKEAPPS